MTTNNNNINPKKPVNFFCELCHFKCCYNKDFQRQLDSLKNRQLGPKWNTAWTNYNNLIKYKKEY